MTATLLQQLINLGFDARASDSGDGRISCRVRDDLKAEADLLASVLGDDWTVEATYYQKLKFGVLRARKVAS